MEERATWTEDGERVPVDTSQPNPNGLEFEYVPAQASRATQRHHLFFLPIFCLTAISSWI